MDSHQIEIGQGSFFCPFHHLSGVQKQTPLGQRAKGIELKKKERRRKRKQKGE
jgi:hypothetical protein